MAGSSKSVEWRERLQRYERAGLTVAAFCRREGVSVPSFYVWRRRLGQASPGRSTRRAKRRLAGSQGQAPAHAFQQVMLSGGGVVAILLPSGVRMELPAQQVQLVRGVLAELLEAESGRSAGGL